MKKVIFYSLYICVLITLNSCKSTHVYSSIQEFNRVVSINKKITGVQFELTDINPDESLQIDEIDNRERPYRVYALLNFDSLQIQELLIQTKNESTLNNEIYLSKIEIRKWFPSHVKKMFHKEGNYFRIKESAYSASLLVQNSPLKGYFIFLDKSSIFLVLYSNR